MEQSGADLPDDGKAVNGSETATLTRPKDSITILQEQLEGAMNDYNQRPTGSLLSGLTAGMEVGFSVFLMGVVYTLFSATLGDGAIRLALALCYPVGFLFVIIGRSMLFTEQTALGVLPVFAGESTIRDLLRLWGIIYCGNVVGGWLFAALLTLVATPMGIISMEAYDHMAHSMVKYNTLLVFGSAIFAGWLMGQLSWLVTGAQETISRMLSIFLVTVVIGLGGLHHSIVGNIELACGVLTQHIGWGDYFRVQLTATIGNAVGGVFFVALLKFSLFKPEMDGSA